MKFKYTSVLFVLLYAAISHGEMKTFRVEASQQSESQRATLFSRQKYRNEYEGYGRAAFSFEHGMRSDNGIQVTRNDYDLLYGNISLNGDSDWFSVSGAADDRSRIRDLGEMNWSDVHYVPMLPVSSEPHAGVRMPAIGESFEESSNGQVTKAVVGHMYLVHMKDRETDLYAMFRVEELVPNDRCVISWRIVPSPER